MITNMSSEQSNLAKLNIWYFIPHLNGLGDLLFGTKICNFLKEHYPNINLTLITDDDGITELQTMVAEEIKPFELLKEKSISHKSEKKISEIDLLIEGPCAQSLLLYGSNFKSNTPVLLMPEYDDENYKSKDIKERFVNTHEILTGFSADAKGIIIDHKLAAFADLPEDKKLEERLKVLDSLTNNFGMVLTSGDTGDNYLANTEVSLAYYPKAFPLYDLCAFKVAQASKNKNLDFIATGDLATVKKQLQDSNFLQKLQQLGFTQVQFQNLDQDPNAEPELWLGKDQNNQSGKIFRILYRNKFIHDDFVKLLKLVNIAGVTGDQSLSEAISCGVVPIYSSSTHKTPAFKNFINILKNYDPDVATVLENLSIQGKKNGKLDESINELLNQPEFKERFNFCAKNIREKHDLLPHVSKIIDELIAKKIQNEQNLVKKEKIIDRNFDNNNNNNMNTTLSLFFEPPPEPEPEAKIIITEDNLHLIAKYLCGFATKQLGEYFQLSESDLNKLGSYYLIEKIFLKDDSKSIDDNDEFIIKFDSIYSDDPTRKEEIIEITLSRAEILAFGDCASQTNQFEL